MALGLKHFFCVCMCVSNVYVCVGRGWCFIGADGDWRCFSPLALARLSCFARLGQSFPCVLRELMHLNRASVARGAALYYSIRVIK